MLNNDVYDIKSIDNDLLSRFDIRFKKEQFIIENDIEKVKDRLNHYKDNKEIDYDEYFKAISLLDMKYRNLHGEQIADKYAIQILNLIDIIKILNLINQLNE